LKSVDNLIQRCNTHPSSAASSLKDPFQISPFPSSQPTKLFLNSYQTHFTILHSIFKISFQHHIHQKKDQAWIAVIWENQTLEMKDQVSLLQEKGRRTTQTGLSNHREDLVLLNWRKSDYTVKWPVAITLLSTALTLLLSPT